MESKDRSALKNLGTWLARITLAMNRPLLHRHIDLKELLYSGYQNGKLGSVLPFVAKVLAGAKNSVVFRPPCPWTMGLLYCLREVYDVPDLKLFLKFEVDMLIKALDVEMQQLKKANLLQTRRQPNASNNPDLKTVPT